MVTDIKQEFSERLNIIKQVYQMEIDGYKEIVDNIAQQLGIQQELLKQLTDSLKVLWETIEVLLIF